VFHRVRTGAVLFTTYVVSVGRLIRHTGIDFHQYADDINTYTSLSSSLADLTTVSSTQTSRHWRSQVLKIGGVRLSFLPLLLLST